MFRIVRYGVQLPLLNIAFPSHPSGPHAHELCPRPYFRGYSSFCVAPQSACWYFLRQTLYEELCSPCVVQQGESKVYRVASSHVVLVRSARPSRLRKVNNALNSVVVEDLSQFSLVFRREEYPFGSDIWDVVQEILHHR